MKQLLLLPILLFTVLSYGQKKTKEERQAELDARKQEVKTDTRELLDYPVKFCTLTLSPAAGKVEASVDYGQNSGNSRNGIADSKGKLIRFHTEMDALNYMYSLGWDLVNAYEGTTAFNRGETRYLLKLRNDAPENHLPPTTADFK